MTAIGPVQLLVLGVGGPELDREVRAELGRLREAQAVRLIDALVVEKDASGRVETRGIDGPGGDAAARSGAVVAALIGLGAGPARETADGVGVSPEDDAWDVIGELPAGTAAAMLLLEHRWAIPLRDALHGANGFHIADDWVHPLDLVAVGLIAAG